MSEYATADDLRCAAFYWRGSRHPGDLDNRLCALADLMDAGRVRIFPEQPEPGALAECGTDERLLWLLRRAGDEWGPLGVALVAARLSDPAAVVAQLTTDASAPREPGSES